MPAENTVTKHIRFFEYQPDRSNKRPESFLKGFNRYLITDGYADIIRHKRRPTAVAGFMPDGMTGGYTGQCYSQDQQSRRRISVLHKAVLSEEEIHICRCQGSERLPPECGFALSGGAFCMAESDPPRKWQQARRDGTVFPASEAATHGVSEQWRCPHLQ